MEIIQPLTAKVWEDRHAWAAEVLQIARDNEITIAGIREFKRKLDARELTTDDSHWLLSAVNEGLRDAGCYLDYKLGLVVE